MADEQDYPTAIVPTRPGTAIERYDAFAKTYGDPMETLFEIQSPLLSGGDTDQRLRAAAELLPYRYTKLRPAETHIHADGAGAVNIQINMGTAPAPKAALPEPAVDPLS